MTDLFTNPHRYGDLEAWRARRSSCTLAGRSTESSSRVTSRSGP